MIVIYSKPTLCLGCHIVVLMTRGETAWSCPQCQKLYPFLWWKIKPGFKKDDEAAYDELGGVPGAEQSASHA